MYLSLSFQCVQEDLKVISQVVLLKKRECSKNCSRKAETVDADTCSIPVGLSRINEPRCLLNAFSTHLDLSSILNSKDQFSAHDGKAFQGFVYQDSRTYKRHLTAVIKCTKKHNEIRAYQMLLQLFVCLRVLCPVASRSSNMD